MKTSAPATICDSTYGRQGYFLPKPIRNDVTWQEYPTLLSCDGGPETVLIHNFPDATFLGRSPNRGGLSHFSYSLSARTTEVSEINETDLILQCSRALVRQIEFNLEEDVEEALAAADVAPTSEAIEACIQIIRRIAPHVALALKLKCAAFGEEDGGVSLVLQSMVTNRRLTCRIAADGSTMIVHAIEETMAPTKITLSTNDASAPRELAAWVTTNA